MNETRRNSSSFLLECSNLSSYTQWSIKWVRLSFLFFSDIVDCSSQSNTCLQLLHFLINSCNWDRSFFEWYILTSFSLWRRSSFSRISTYFAFSSFNPCLGRILIHKIILETSAWPSIQWFRFTCIDILKSIFQMCIFFYLTMCLKFSWNSSFLLLKMLASLKRSDF